MLKKKAMLAVAAAAAVVMANPILNKAHAATFTPTTQEKVYVYKASNMDEINSIIEKYLASLGMTVSQNTVKQPAPTPAPVPAPNGRRCAVLPGVPHGCAFCSDCSDCLCSTGTCGMQLYASCRAVHAIAAT